MVTRCTGNIVGWPPAYYLVLCLLVGVALSAWMEGRLAAARAETAQWEVRKARSIAASSMRSLVQIREQLTLCMDAGDLQCFRFLASEYMNASLL